MKHSMDHLICIRLIYTYNKAAFQLSVLQWYVATMIKVSKTTDSLLKKKYTLVHFVWLGF